LVNQRVGKGKLGFKRDESVLGFLKSGADFSFVGSGETKFVGSEVSEHVGGFKFPKFVQFDFRREVVDVNVVEIVQVGQELFGSGAFLLVSGCHLFSQKGKQIVDDNREFRPRTDEKKAAVLASSGVYVSTSSWKYEGWFGQLYNPTRYEYRGKVAKTRFERDCLQEYAEVFKTVSVDAAYYDFPRRE